MIIKTVQMTIKTIIKKTLAPFCHVLDVFKLQQLIGRASLLFRSPLGHCLAFWFICDCDCATAVIEQSLSHPEVVGIGAK